MPELTQGERAALAGWRQLGYADGLAGKQARTPIRDDGGIARDGYLAGYRLGLRSREEALKRS